MRLLLLLVGCRAVSDPGSPCTVVFYTTCEHQLACDLAPDFQSCVIELEQEFVCDFEQPRARYERCADSGDTPCSEPIPRACAAVLRPTAGDSGSAP